MVDLSHEERAALVRFLLIGDIDRHPADANNMVRAVEARGGRADAPAHLPVRPLHAKFRLTGLRIRAETTEHFLEIRPVIGMNDGPKRSERRGALRIDTEDTALTLVPGKLLLLRVPVP